MEFLPEPETRARHRAMRLSIMREGFDPADRRRSKRSLTMHIPDGLLSAPICVVSGTAAAGAVAYSLKRLSGALGDRLVPLMGVMAACVFAGQMVNFPVPGGTSGHLMGGVLAAVMLGPWAATVAITLVLVVQCFLFGDGGVTALGANVLNLAVAGAMIGYLVYVPVRRAVSGIAGIVIGAVTAAWLSVILAAGLCSLEVALSGRIPLGVVLPTMLLVHSWIGIGEALITGLTLSYVVQTRPDLIYGVAASDSVPIRVGQLAGAGLVVALVVVVFLAPLASSAPDGFESVAAAEGFAQLEKEGGLPALFPDYRMPGVSTLWLATSLSGAAGVAAVAGIAWALGRGVRYRAIK